MDIQKLLNGYAEWLKNEITHQKFGEYYELTVPFWDAYNDYLQIYVRQDGDGLCFTDDATTLRNLGKSIFESAADRKARLQKILDKYGVELVGDELTARTPTNDFPQRLHQFIQAMLKIASMSRSTQLLMAEEEDCL